MRDRQELVLGDARNDRRTVHTYRGDLPVAAGLHELDARLGMEPTRSMTGRGKALGERHREAPGVRGREQLLRGRRRGLRFEVVARLRRERHTHECAGVGRERAGILRIPDSGGSTIHVALLAERGASTMPGRTLVRRLHGNRLMRTVSRAGIVTLSIAVAAVLLGGTCMATYNRLVRLDQAAQAQWAQVQNAYQRRADLIPNLV